MTSPRPGAPAFTLLLVCTGNICRSALAERLARAYLDEALGERASVIQVVSAGTRAVVGSGLHPDSALVLQGYGGEAGDFRACQLDETIAAGADLTLTMTRAHRREALAVAPRGLSRTFTLREAAALLQLVAEDTDHAGATFPERARGLVAALAAVRSRRSAGEDDDVPHPIGQPIEMHQEVGDAIAAAFLPLLGRLADLHRPGGPGQ